MIQEVLTAIDSLLNEEMSLEVISKGNEIQKQLTTVLQQNENELKEIEAFQDQLKEKENAISKEANSTEEPEEEGSSEETVEIVAPVLTYPEETIASLSEKWQSYTTSKEEFFEKKKEAEKANFESKKQVINELKLLISDEENIGRAYKRIKELQDTWKEIGNVPRGKDQELFVEYQKELETFYFNINIYKELREHDLKRNQKVKEQIIVDLEASFTLESIKKTEEFLRTKQALWDATGPTYKDNWEELKDKYWAVVRSLYQKIDQFYDEKRKEQQENLNKKKALVVKCKEFVEQGKGQQRDWNTSTQQILALQEEWKSIGFSGKGINDEVWNEFKSLTSFFFEEKNQFYKTLRSSFEENHDKKKALLKKAIDCQVSTDWKRTTEQFIKLQKDWKSIGSAGRKYEQDIWLEFRGACDHFFNAKNEHFSGLQEEEQKNLELKIALIEEINAFKLTEELSEDLNLLKEFSNKFNQIGNVPFKEKEKIYQAYDGALEQHYSHLKMDKLEKENILFEAKLTSIRESHNPEALFDKERETLHKKITKLQEQVNLYENNLGFFANSKGANTLKTEYETKIEKSKSEIDSLKSKLKLIP